MTQQNPLSTVSVELAERSYDVVIGPGAREHLASLIWSKYRSAAVITQANVGWSVDPGIDHTVFTIGDGEAHKTLDTVGELCSSMARAGFSRADCVIGVGGGMVTDIAGFVAASYHRGIPVIHVSTTLLGQVDAAIGGKTGVNLPEGKNLVGAYWQPSGVICDTDTLTTLPPREMRCGLGEVAKYHWLDDVPAAHSTLESLPLAEKVARCVAIKAAVVAADEREGSKRALLNYGHTLAHAIETAGEHRLAHGEAVGIGLIYAAEVARRMGRIDDNAVALHRRIVAGYDLPMSLPEGLTDDDLVSLMARDKKATTGFTMVLDGRDGVEVVDGLERAVLIDALRAVR